MKAKGFHHRDGRPFGKEWIGYCFLVLLLCSVLSILTSAFCLHYFRMEPQPSGKVDVQESSPEVEESERDAEVEKEESSFIPVDLSFNNLCYEVKASTGKKKLRLLNNISGIFRSGRMCALMGESGAGEYSVTLYSYTLQQLLTLVTTYYCLGKTTLMDVIALRKGGVLSFGSSSTAGVSGDV